MRRPEGGLVSLETLEDAGGEVPSKGAGSDGPERAFHNSWAVVLTHRVLARFSEENSSPERRAHIEIFRRFLVAPILERADPPSQKELALEFGLTEKEVANRVLTGRRAFQRLFHAEVAAYVRSDAEAREEVQELLQQLGQG